MPPLAVFPKAFMQALCKDGTMRVSEWIELAVLLNELDFQIETLDLFESCEP